MSGFSKLALPAAVAQVVMVGDRNAIAQALKCWRKRSWGFQYAIEVETYLGNGP